MPSEYKMLGRLHDLSSALQEKRKQLLLQLFKGLPPIAKKGFGGYNISYLQVFLNSS